MTEASMEDRRAETRDELERQFTAAFDTAAEWLKHEKRRAEHRVGGTGPDTELAALDDEHYLCALGVARIIEVAARDVRHAFRAVS